MGNALRSLVHDMKGKKVADGKSVGGKGHLTQDKSDSFQRYYGKAIRDKSQKSGEDTKNAIWAIYHHSISNPEVSLEKQHKFCPQGMNSWCKFITDGINGTNSYSEQTRLPAVFLEQIKPVVERLTDAEVLSKCQLGSTQNANESCHTVLWSKWSKTSFCGKERLLLAVGETVGTFNTGAGFKKHLLRAAGIPNAGVNTLRMLKREDDVRKKYNGENI